MEIDDSGFSNIVRHMARSEKVQERQVDLVVVALFSHRWHYQA